MTVHVEDGNLSIAEEWEKFCVETSHYLATRYNDEINAIFKPQPYTIYVLDDNKTLLGGCKIHLSESRLLPSFMRSISRSCSQLGEYLIKPGLDENVTKEVIQILHTAFGRFIKEKNIAFLKVGGYYGYIDRLYKIEGLPGLKMVNVGLIDLTQSVEALWENIHSKHRNKIRKAETANVQIVSGDDIESLILILDETFSKQEGRHSPNHDYLKTFFKIAKDSSDCQIYKAYYNDQLCGATLIHGFGTLANYSFAGSNRVYNGANNLMQWRIIQDFKSKGYKTYSLGNIAFEGESYGNEKFEDGISSFKTRFGCSLHPSYVAEYVLSPFKNKLWKTILKGYNKIKKN